MREWFEQLPRRFLPEKARQLRALIQFRLSGANDGDWVVVIMEGVCRVWEGLAEAPDATISTTAEDWMAMVEGTLDPATAYFTGRLIVTGDINLVTHCLTLFSK